MIAGTQPGTSSAQKQSDLKSEKALIREESLNCGTEND